MSDFPQQPEQRDFYCSLCNGRIVIPFSLPSTSGPCPHCGETIVSPPPPEPSSAPEEVLEAPQKPVHLPPASRTGSNATRQTLDPVHTEEPPVSDTTPKPAPTPPGKERKASTGIMSGMLVLLFLILGGGAAFYYMTQSVGTEVPPPEFPIPPTATISPESEYKKTGWEKDAAEVLEKFLAGRNAEEKLPHINDPKRLQPKLTEFYGDAEIDDSDTPADAFQANDNLPDKDLSRGIFMMTYTQPLKAPLQNFTQLSPSSEGVDQKDTPVSPNADDSNSASDTVRVLAFFKRSADGLKLDWETFAQTKYRLFQNFIDRREIGSSETFRVLLVGDVTKDDKAATGMLSYRLIDPTTMEEAAVVTLDADSEVGRVLSTLNKETGALHEPNTRTATVELVWSDQAGEPKLEVKRLVSWEFLGLGGTEIPAGASEQ